MQKGHGFDMFYPPGLGSPGTSLAFLETLARSRPPLAAIKPDPRVVAHMVASGVAKLFENSLVASRTPMTDIEDPRPHDDREVFLEYLGVNDDWEVFIKEGKLYARGLDSNGDATCVELHVVGVPVKLDV